MVATDEDGTLRFIHSDHLGSSSVATNALGDIVANSTYFPYGGHRSSTGAFGTDRDFTGQRLDGGTGLHFYNARYYDSALGRFISPDSIVPNSDDPSAWNRYSYVRNNPLRYTDPTGHCWGSCWKAFRNAAQVTVDVGKTFVSDPATAAHTGLDVVGLVPVFGEAADAINAVWYLAEGNHVDAGLSAAALIPIGGQAATAAKLTKKTAQGIAERVGREAVGGATPVRKGQEGVAAARALLESQGARHLASEVTIDSITVNGRITARFDMVMSDKYGEYVVEVKNAARTRLSKNQNSVASALVKGDPAAGRGPRAIDAGLAQRIQQMRVRIMNMQTGEDYWYSAR